MCSPIVQVPKRAGGSSRNGRYHGCRIGRTRPWLRIARIVRKIGSNERSTAAALYLDFLTTGALFSDSFDLLTQSDSQAISFGSSVNESSSVSLLTLAQILESLMYTRAGAFPLFSHSCMHFPQNGSDCRNMDRIGQKSNFFYISILSCKTICELQTAVLALADSSYTQPSQGRTRRQLPLPSQARIQRTPCRDS